MDLGNLFTISFRVTTLALGQWYDCPSACELTLQDMGMSKLPVTEPQQNMTNQNQLYICWDIRQSYTLPLVFHRQLNIQGTINLEGLIQFP